MLAVTQVFGGAGVSTVATVGGLTAAQLSGSATVGGLALTAGALGAALVGLPLARTARRAGRRTGLRRGYLIAATGAVAAAVAVTVGSWPLLLAASVLLGAANATTLAARFAATDLARPTAARSRPVGGAVGDDDRRRDRAEPRGTRRTAGARPSARCPRPDRASCVRPCSVRPRSACTRACDPTRCWWPEPRRAEQTAPPARSGARPVWTLATTAVVVAQAVMVGLMAMAPLHLAHGGADLRVVGLTISAHVGAMYALSPLFGWLSDRVGRLPVLGLGAGLLIAAAGVGATATPHAVLQLTCALALLGTGWSAVLVSGSALLVDAVPAAERPRVQGRTDALMNLGGAVGGALAGGIVAATSYPTLCALATALPALVLVAVVRRVRRPR